MAFAVRNYDSDIALCSRLMTSLFWKQLADNPVAWQLRQHIIKTDADAPHILLVPEHRAYEEAFLRMELSIFGNV